MIRDIVYEVRKRIELKKDGKFYLALCPFHFEKYPSFFINPFKNTYHCFGCRASGDVYKFVRQYEDSLKKESQWMR